MAKDCNLKWFLFAVFLLSGGIARADIFGQQSSLPSGLTEQRVQEVISALDRGDVESARLSLDAALVDASNSNHREIVLAQILLNLNRGKAAIRILEEFAASNESPFEAHVAFVEIAMQQGRLFDAWTHAMAAAKLAPPQEWDTDRSTQAKKDLLRNLANIANQRRDWDQVERLTNRMLENAPNDVEAFALKANSAFARGEYQVTEELLRKVVSTRTEKGEPTASTELMMAKLFSQIQDEKLTDLWFEKAIQVESSLQKNAAKLEYAKWLIAQNAPDKALQHANEFETDADAGKAEKKYAIALANRMLGNFSAAEEAFAELHQASSQNPAFGNQLALCLVESSDEGKRARALQLALTNARNSPSSETLSTLGWIQLRLGDQENAEKSLNAAAQSGIISRDTAFYISKLKASQGDSASATQFLGAAMNGKGEFFNLNRVDTLNF